MKAEHNTITNSRQRKGTERIKSRCEKTIAKTKTYRNKKPKYVNRKHSLRKHYRNKLTRSKPMNIRHTKQEYLLIWSSGKKRQLKLFLKSF